MIRRKKIGRWKMDKQSTALAQFVDRRSYVGMRIHPGTERQCVYLFGDDASQARRATFEREKGRCWNCGAYYGLAYGELRHRKGGYTAERCWCAENLGWGCPKCHRNEHGREPRWSKPAFRIIEEEKAS